MYSCEISGWIVECAGSCDACEQCSRGEHRAGPTDVCLFPSGNQLVCALLAGRLVHAARFNAFSVHLSHISQKGPAPPQLNRKGSTM